MEAKDQPPAAAAAPPPPPLINKEQETKLETANETEVASAETATILEDNRSLKTEEEESKNLLEVPVPSLTKAQASGTTDTSTVIDVSMKEISGAETAEELVKEETEAELPGTLVTPTALEVTDANVVTATTELVKEAARNPSDVTPISATLVSGTGAALVTETPEEETKGIEHVNEETKETELPGPSATATPDYTIDINPDTETLEEHKGVELVDEETKATELPDVTPGTASGVSLFTETTEDTKSAEPKHEEETKKVKLSHETSVTETTKELANPKPEVQLLEEETKGPNFHDASVAANDVNIVTETVEEENKEAQLVKEEIWKAELPDPSLAATPVADTGLTPDTKPSEAAAVTQVDTKKERALNEEVKAESLDASPILAKSTDAESEVAEVLGEKKKKKKKPLGDHLAEEKAKDSASANKLVSDENSDVELLEEEPLTSAVAPKESTEIASRELNITEVTKTEGDEKKEEDKKVVENAAIDETATEFTEKGKSEKLDEKESVEPAKGAMEEVASKLTSRSSNNILSKVKHQIVKAKKAIIRKSPSSKKMSVENKDDITVK